MLFFRIRNLKIRFNTCSGKFIPTCSAWQEESNPKVAQKKKNRKTRPTSLKLARTGKGTVIFPGQRKIYHFRQYGKQYRFNRSSRHICCHCLQGFINFCLNNDVLAAPRHLSFFTARAWIFPGMNQIHGRQLAHTIVVMYCDPGGNCQEVHGEYGDEKAAHEIELLMQKWAAGKKLVADFCFSFK